MSAQRRSLYFMLVFVVVSSVTVCEKRRKEMTTKHWEEVELWLLSFWGKLYTNAERG